MFINLTEPMKSNLLFNLGCATLLGGALSHAQTLEYANSIDLGAGAGEVVSYAGGRLAVTNNPVGGVSLFDIGNDFSFNNQVNVDFAGASYTGGFTFSTVTSVAIDSRGFGFAAIQGSGAASKLGVFNSATGAILGTYDVGNNADMVRVSGDRVFVANEGEFGASGTFTGAADTAGSMDYYSFSGATGASDVIGSFSSLTSVGFSGFTDAALDEAGIRRHDDSYAADESYKNLEPEYIAVSGDKAFVTLQENNAIAVIDLNTNTVESINNLGTHVVTIDASDKDGLAIEETVKALIMPDSIETFEVGGKTYVVVGSEGDARGDDGDIQRAEDFTGVDSDLVNNNPDNLNLTLDDENIGRLDLVIDQSDTDGDGDLDDVVALSSRDVTVLEYNEVTGELVEVSNVGTIEAVLAAADPARHNANDGGNPGEFDKRSDNKGPELEAIDVAEISGQILAVVGAERQGGLLLIDLTDPENISVIDDSYSNGYANGLISPETLQFAEINGKMVVIAGFEGIPDDNVSGGIGIYQVVPEPRAYAMIAGALALMVSICRRRR